LLKQNTKKEETNGHIFCAEIAYKVRDRKKIERTEGIRRDRIEEKTRSVKKENNNG
jgi:hypothetical protein